MTRTSARVQHPPKGGVFCTRSHVPSSGALHSSALVRTRCTRTLKGRTLEEVSLNE